jgi:predicted MFS family arabinose efflux permease
MVALVPAMTSGPRWIVLLGLTFGCGCWAVVFDVGLQGLLPRTVDRDHLPAANGWFARVSALADVTGPPAAGVIVSLAGPATAIAVDACTFAASGLLLLFLRESPAPTTTRLPTRLEWTAGARHVLTEPLLRATTAVVLLLNLGGAMIGALWVVYATGPLRLTPATLGMITAAGGLSALLGSVVVGIVSRRLGPRRSLVGGFAGAVLALLCIPTATLGAPILSLMTYQLLFSASAVVVAVNAATVRQLHTPPDRQARVYAVIRSCQDVILPAGSTAAALLTAATNINLAVIVGAATAATAIPTAARITRSRTKGAAPWVPNTESWSPEAPAESDWPLPPRSARPAPPS